MHPHKVPCLLYPICPEPILIYEWVEYVLDFFVDSSSVIFNPVQMRMRVCRARASNTYHMVVATGNRAPAGGARPHDGCACKLCTDAKKSASYNNSKTKKPCLGSPPRSKNEIIPVCQNPPADVEHVEMATPLPEPRDGPDLEGHLQIAGKRALCGESQVLSATFRAPGYHSTFRRFFVFYWLISDCPFIYFPCACEFMCEVLAQTLRRHLATVPGAEKLDGTAVHWHSIFNIIAINF